MFDCSCLSMRAHTSLSYDASIGFLRMYMPFPLLRKITFLRTYLKNTSSSWLYSTLNFFSLPRNVKCWSLASGLYHEGPNMGTLPHSSDAKLPLLVAIMSVRSAFLIFFRYFGLQKMFAVDPLSKITQWVCLLLVGHYSTARAHRPIQRHLGLMMTPNSVAVGFAAFICDTAS